jgi:hypothetical protein
MPESDLATPIPSTMSYWRSSLAAEFLLCDGAGAGGLSAVLA